VSRVDSLRGASVLVVGDLMLDEYVWGEVHRISPEAPVPVVDVSRRTRLAGGAANAAAGVVALGGKAMLAGVLGDDPGAEALRQAMADTGVDAGDVIVDQSRPTTTKVRVIAHSQQVVRADSETRDPLSGELEEQVIRHVTDRLADADALLISDYGKGVVSERVARTAIDAARERDVPVIVDSKGLHYSRFRGATVITPNVHDAERASKIQIEGEDHLREAARRLSEDCGGAALLITRGAAGMTLFSVDHPLHVPAQARDVFDVTGAGDTVVAVLSVALGRGVPLPDAVRLANTAAGIVVGKVGTSTVTLDELAKAVEAGDGV
jgi:rfaE bifunctional protein kinase chain/domain